MVIELPCDRKIANFCRGRFSGGVVYQKKGEQSTHRKHRTKSQLGGGDDRNSRDGVVPKMQFWRGCRQRLHRPDLLKQRGSETGRCWDDLLDRRAFVLKRLAAPVRGIAMGQGGLASRGLLLTDDPAWPAARRCGIRLQENDCQASAEVKVIRSGVLVSGGRGSGRRAIGIRCQDPKGEWPERGPWSVRIIGLFPRRGDHYPAYCRRWSVEVEFAKRSKYGISRFPRWGVQKQVWRNERPSTATPHDLGWFCRVTLSVVGYSITVQGKTSGTGHRPWYTETEDTDVCGDAGRACPVQSMGKKTGLNGRECLRQQIESEKNCVVAGVHSDTFA